MTSICSFVSCLLTYFISKRKTTESISVKTAYLFQDIYQGSEVTSIKLSNTSKRNYPLGEDFEEKSAKDNMQIKLLVKVGNSVLCVCVLERKKRERKSHEIA